MRCQWCRTRDSNSTRWVRKRRFQWGASSASWGAGSQTVRDQYAGQTDVNRCCAETWPSEWWSSLWRDGANAGCARGGGWRWTRSSLPSSGASTLAPNCQCNHETRQVLCRTGQRPPTAHAQTLLCTRRPTSAPIRPNCPEAEDARVWLDMHFALEIRLRRVPGH